MSLRRKWVWCAAVLLTCGPVGSAEPPPQLEVSNAVDSCLRFTSPQFRSDGRVLLLELYVEHRQSTASCGCKSALLTYRVTERIAASDASGEIFSGRLSSLEASLGSRALLVIDTDQSILRRGDRTLSIGCAAPE